MRRAALSMREVIAGVERRDALAQDWAIWLGPDWMTIPVPNETTRPDVYVSELGIDLLILTGGNDLMPSRLRESDLSPRRDRTERELLRVALERGTPVLAVCRGLHLVNLHFGGAISPDLEGEGIAAGSHVARTHEVRLERSVGDWRAGSTIRTNSFHNQGVLPAQVAAPLETLALSELDGVVEALFHPAFPLVALQWHPERDGSPEGFDRTLLDMLTDARLPWLET